VVVSGLSHDFCVIAGLITSKILTCFFMPLDDLSRSASQEFTVGGEYEKRGMKNYATGNDLNPSQAHLLV
jgi:hypothetical protein